MRFETKAVHAGGEVDDDSGALAPPIELSTTFLRTPDGRAARDYSYIRDRNPTQDRLERALASLDSGAAAIAFASGMAAASSLLQSLGAGAHVILPDDSYYAMRSLAADFLPRWGLTFDFVSLQDLDCVRRSMRPETRVIWAESPSNPLMKVADLRALAELARSAGALLIVDGTFATPALQRPLECGASVVLHSTTKYFGGHSDVQGGAVVFQNADPYYEKVLHTRTILGSVASPFNSWLVLRGLRTLGARMRVHCENARAVAAFLAGHAGVEVVHYPGLESHAGHAVARRQMSDFGGMLSFQVRGGREEALAVTARTKIFTRATSLGGVESLIEHRASSEGVGSRTPQNLLRLSIGIEHPEDLIADLAAALA